MSRVSLHAYEYGPFNWKQEKRVILCNLIPAEKAVFVWGNDYFWSIDEKKFG